MKCPPTVEQVEPGVTQAQSPTTATSHWPGQAARPLQVGVQPLLAPPRPGEGEGDDVRVGTGCL